MKAIHFFGLRCTVKWFSITSGTYEEGKSFEFDIYLKELDRFKRGLK